ncbi:unnamed protein product [Ceutorhynchus assimilis]|uniref:CUB domain-containing protein n=1 Tax=Ceutorhynchus assimilis TaxID=467358 RepID=A0A9N9MDE1_9CUCU|nr:unnamed protein product [Ceutorhynchus assimilis]
MSQMFPVEMRILFCAFILGFAQSLPPMYPEAISICDSKGELALPSKGEASAQTVTLQESALSEAMSLCRLKVTAPKSHVVNLQFLDPVNETRRTENDTKDQGKKPSCVMSIYLPDNTKAPFWKGDPCSEEKLPDVDLLTSEFKILWTPPNNETIPVLHNTFLLTAVGSGSFCKDPFQHTCMRIGNIPMLCISDHLVCDGYPNCPKSSTNNDEDPRLCKTAKNAWEKFVVELVKKYRPQSDGEGQYALKPNFNSSDEWFEWQLTKKNATKPPVLNETHSATESISAMLNKYGPWGYLMMGLLICGTVLFFCGLWECCCKRPKPRVDAPCRDSPNTVMVMDCGHAVTNPMPPQYDELDLPPSYTTLFPADEGRYTSVSEDTQEPVASSSSDEIEKPEDVNQSLNEENIETRVAQETV